MGARRGLLTAGLAFSFVLSSSAGAGSLTGGWTEATQKNNLLVWLGEGVAHAKKIAELAQMGVYLFNKFSDMEEQARNLLPMDWQSFLGYVDELDSVISRGRALSFASIAAEQQFQQYHKGYSDYLADVKRYDKNYFIQTYHNWNLSLQDSLRNTLKVNNLTFERIKDDEARMQLIQERMRHATTRNELLRVSADIALVTVQQLRRLVAIKMQHSQTHMQFMAYRKNKAELSRVRKQAFLQDGQRPTLGDGEQW